MARYSTALLLGLALGLCCGCSGGKPTVSGEVTLDGKPLEEGIIRFVPADGKSQTASAPISKGRYRAEPPPGEHRVEISAPKVVGKRKMYDAPDVPAVDDVVELLPARYNVKSELTLTVKPGSQTKDFPLSSK
jgi:hypothetical protein